jgi:hypothetical protein
MLNERKRKWFDGIVWSLSLLFAAALVTTARAESHRFAVDNAAYRTECGSCHIAYPPALLDRDAWRAITGTDNTLDRRQRHEHTRRRAYVVDESRKHSSAHCICTLVRKEHADMPPHGSLQPKSAELRSCHRQASADYSERNVRIPR